MKININRIFVSYFRIVENITKNTAMKSKPLVQPGVSALPTDNKMKLNKDEIWNGKNKK